MGNVCVFSISVCSLYVAIATCAAYCELDIASERGKRVHLIRIKGSDPNVQWKDFSRSTSYKHKKDFTFGSARMLQVTKRLTGIEALETDLLFRYTFIGPGRSL